jgi:hypothetical protein
MSELIPLTDAELFVVAGGGGETACGCKPTKTTTTTKTNTHVNMHWDRVSNVSNTSLGLNTPV